MAWRNISLNYINTLNIINMNIVGSDIETIYGSNVIDTTQFNQLASSFVEPWENQSYRIYNMQEGDYIFGTSAYGLICSEVYINPRNKKIIYLSVIKNGTINDSYQVAINAGKNALECQYFGFAALVDDSNQLGCWFFIAKEPEYDEYLDDTFVYESSNYGSANGGYTEIYNLLIANEAVSPKVWTPVTSLTGNNKTILLPKIKTSSLNDGDPVINGSISDFELLPSQSKVINLMP